jgi:two-component system response regulator HydG
MTNTFNILVADDDLTLSNILTDELATAGFAVDRAPDGVVAMDLLKNKGYDIALLDINMPTANGFEVLDFIHRNTPSTKVIMITAYADVQNAIKAIRLGASDFVSKPFDIDGLIASINRVLGV